LAQLEVKKVLVALVVVGTMVHGKVVQMIGSHRWMEAVAVAPP
jgi:hypothetical protein